MRLRAPSLDNQEKMAFHDYQLAKYLGRSKKLGCGWVLRFRAANDIQLVIPPSKSCFVEEW
jgi:hypothetical protein